MPTTILPRRVSRMVPISLAFLSSLMSLIYRIIPESPASSVHWRVMIGHMTYDYLVTVLLILGGAFLLAFLVGLACEILIPRLFPVGKASACKDPHCKRPHGKQTHHGESH